MGTCTDKPEIIMSVREKRAYDRAGSVGGGGGRDAKTSPVRFIFFIFAFFLLLFYYMPPIYKSISGHCETPLCLPSPSILWESPPPGYLIHTPHCKISDMNPFDTSVLKYIKKIKPKRCPRPLITTSGQVLKYDEALLEYKTATCCFREIHRVTQDPVKFNSKADWSIRKSSCTPISKLPNITIVPTEFVQIDCKYKIDGQEKTKVDYQGVVISPKNQSNRTIAKVQFWENSQNVLLTNNVDVIIGSTLTSDSDTNVTESDNDDDDNMIEGTERKEQQLLQTISSVPPPPPSVLIIGIDSISRLHMIRSMSKTKKFLSDNDFIEMKGYTKIGENTFPNIMGALGGMDLNKYPCFNNSIVDNCPLIWKNFSSHNYVTAFLEDSPGLAIFNYMKTGFVKQPTDYYLRPLAVAYHGNLGRHSGYQGCVGGSSQTDFMIKYIRDFEKQMGRTIPYFLFSWFTSIGHDDFNGLETADANFRDLLRDSVKIGGENTVILFISDHGYRFGSFRETFLGYYEESLPFFFVRLPPTLKRSHPDWYINLRVNSQRLTSPLDLHASLEDILSLSTSTSTDPAISNANSASPETSGNVTLNNTNNNNQSWSDSERQSNISTLNTNIINNTTPPPFTFTHFNRQPGFRKTYSFFEETPRNRTCESSGIPQIYCRCGVHPEVGKTSKKSKKFGEIIIKSVNGILENEIKANHCVPLKFSKFLYLRELTDGEVWNNFGKLITYKDHLVALEAAPSKAHFETKVRLFSNETTVVVGDISRINSYQGQNDCETDFALKNYCMCKDYYEKMLLTKKTEEAKKKAKEKKKAGRKRRVVPTVAA